MKDEGATTLLEVLIRAGAIAMHGQGCPTWQLSAQGLGLPMPG